MIEKLNVEELSRTLAGAVPAGLVNIGADLEKTFKAILQGSFERMNLVSREEFEVQKQVLAKTREKLEDLEIRVAKLEQGLIKE